MFRKMFSRKMLLFALLIVICAGCSGNLSGDLNETPIEETKQITVYFMDEPRYAVGTEPYEAAVERTVPIGADEAEAILLAYFEGPTADEYDRGLRAVTSSCTGYSKLEIQEGIARVFLAGNCSSGGATYTIANLISKNLKQLDAVSFVKIYDLNGDTEVPEGSSDSIPVSLEP